jgi:hypothetical protein
MRNKLWQYHLEIRVARLNKAYYTEFKHRRLQEQKVTIRALRIRFHKGIRIKVFNQRRGLLRGKYR